MIRNPVLRDEFTIPAEDRARLRRIIHEHIRQLLRYEPAPVSLVDESREAARLLAVLTDPVQAVRP